MRTLLLAVMVSTICAMRVFASGVAVGMERSDVEAALGKPSAVLQRDNRQVLIYPKNGRVELADGRVVEMANVPLNDEVFGSTEPPAAESQAVPKTAKPAENKIGEDQSKAKSQAASSEPSHHKNQRAPEEDEFKSDESAPLPILGVLIVGIFRAAVMVVVLKLSFKWADVHADWVQMIIPAISDTVVRTVIRIFAEKVLKTEDLFYADEALAYFALIFVLRKTTHACTLGRALGVAAAAKLVSMVVGSLIVVIVLNMLAG